jgi:uncharacterized membrane protein
VVGGTTFGFGSPSYCRNKHQQFVDLSESGIKGYGVTYLTLQCSDQQTIKDLSCLITMPDILECFGCILSTDIEQNFLSTSAKNQISILDSQ